MSEEFILLKNNKNNKNKFRKNMVCSFYIQHRMLCKIPNCSVSNCKKYKCHFKKCIYVHEINTMSDTSKYLSKICEYQSFENCIHKYKCQFIHTDLSYDDIDSVNWLNKIKLKNNLKNNNINNNIKNNINNNINVNKPKAKNIINSENNKNNEISSVKNSIKPCPKKSNLPFSQNNNKPSTKNMKINVYESTDFQVKRVKQDNDSKINTNIETDVAFFEILDNKFNSNNDNSNNDNNFNNDNLNDNNFNDNIFIDRTKYGVKKIINVDMDIKDPDSQNLDKLLIKTYKDEYSLQKRRATKWKRNYEILNEYCESLLDMNAVLTKRINKLLNNK